MNSRIKAAMILLVALLGCSREDAEVSYPREGSPIEFVRTAPTKAFTESNDSTVTGFGVTALLSSGSAYFQNRRTVKVSDALERVESYYWNGSNLSFFACYPYTSMTKSGTDCTLAVGSTSSPFAGTSDYVCAVSKGVTPRKEPVALTFSHILSAVDSIVFTGGNPDCIFKVTALSMTGLRYGTYSLGNNRWSNTDRTGRTISLGGSSAFRGDGSAAVGCGLTFIPGTSSFSVTYDVTTPAGVTFSVAKKVSLSLAAGKRSVVRATLTDTFDYLSLSVSLGAWTGESDNLSMGGVFSVLPGEVVCGPTGGSFSIIITCASSWDTWTAGTLPGWVHLSGTSGSGDGTITLTVDSYGGSDGRQADIVFSSGDATATLKVIQNGSFDAGVDINPFDDEGGYGEQL